MNFKKFSVRELEDHVGTLAVGFTEETNDLVAHAIIKATALGVRGIEYAFEDLGLVAIISNGSDDVESVDSYVIVRPDGSLWVPIDGYGMVHFTTFNEDGVITFGDDFTNFGEFVDEFKDEISDEQFALLKALHG